MGYASRTAPGGTSQHLAEQCGDESCPRLPCRMFKAGYEKGWREGYAKGYADGYTAGYADGFGAGMAAGYQAGFAAGMAAAGGG